MAIDPDELLPSRRQDLLKALATEDLDPWSLAELDARIASLEAEIARTRAKRDSATAFRAAADSLFGKKP
jgi:uncharacterized small protein (DUF1192 family)